MFNVIVNTRHGTRVNSVSCSTDSCLIGKDPDCLIVLRGWKVGKVHARLTVQQGELFIEDMGSATGTYVNENKTRRYGPLTPEDSILIHGYRLHVQPAQTTQQPERPMQDLVDSNAVLAPATAKTALVAVQHDDKEPDVARIWRRRVHKSLLEQLDLRRINTFEMSDAELRALTSELVRHVLDDIEDFPAGLDRAEIGRQVLNEAVGLGPLEDLLGQDDITEIMVNCADEIFFERAGRLYKSPVTFTDNTSVMFAIERIVAPLGRRIDESSPMVDARLKDGSRVNAIIPPLALKGPCITIRKFSKTPLTPDRLVSYGSISWEMVQFLEQAVKNRHNIIISGGTGSGKTTLLNMLSAFIPEDERIVTVEDAAELQLSQPNLISLEARPPNQEGRGAVAIRDLIRNCLRMRPDRIVVGECRGGEALDMLQAMNTGHDGSLTTVHANSPRDCISRLEVMVMMSGMDLPVQAIREQISSAVHLIVQQSRFSCGSRKVTSIAELTGIENGRVQMGEIFRFAQSGYDEHGKVQGQLVATGLIPELYERLRSQGIAMDIGMFRDGVMHAH
ncbi:Flp pilus assembly complex ATPase component TadA [Halopseudomonas nanhaiensis]|uniref:ATPase, T2SS/T4P/T4SS family n=1 Tax=Halopseudomonas nanhaiensis TaxID=2830842 RepID=UPI001CC0DF39|nr:ATPase, T2SS/T4P/T4SS family [Halopseudomonas nanhaiensis]UAW99505.1 Flp pilus assembly complex ATPase component TadA [Halopseudomonas nanhaiensis]